MKKKILSLVLILVLVLSMFILTACGEDSSESKKSEDSSSSVNMSSPEKVIKAAIKAYNDQDKDKLADMVDLKGAAKFTQQGSIQKSELKEELEELFEEFDCEFEVKEIKLLENDKDFMEETDIDKNDIDDLKDSYKGYEFYTVKLEADTDSYYLEEYMENLDISELKDIVVLSKKSGEYKLVSSALVTSSMVAQQGILTRAEKASAATAKADAEQSIKLAVVMVQEDFINKWAEDTTLVFSKTLEYSELEKKLSEYDYEFVGKNSGLVFKNGESEVTVKFKRKNEDTTYKATLVASDPMGINVKDVEVDE